MMEATRRFLAGMGLPSGELHALRKAAKRTGDHNAK